MNITYRPFYFNSDEDCGRLAEWSNDPALKHLINRFPSQEACAKEFTPDHYRSMGRNPPLKGTSKRFMIQLDDVPVGHARLDLNTHGLLCQTGNTAGIHLFIADKSLHGLGVGKRTVRHLEALSTEAGALRIEATVFEYNEHARGFFTALGYDEFLHTPEGTWWDGRQWAEIRMLRFL